MAAMQQPRARGALTAARGFVVGAWRRLAAPTVNGQVVIPRVLPGPITSG